MICCIHQPNFIPYIWLFKKIQASDVCVFYDTAQYTKWDFHNRNSIVGANGKILLSIPVSVKLGQKINEVTFDVRVLQKFWKTIEQSYKKAPFFEKHKNSVESIFLYKGNNLSEFNIESIQSLCTILWIERKFKLTSELELDPELKSTDALIDICKKVWSQWYLSGDGGKNYIEEGKFLENNIELLYQNFHHPIYTQKWDTFIPYLSIIDCIFYNDTLPKN